MHNKRRLLWVILVTPGFALALTVSHAGFAAQLAEQKHPGSCTKEALAARKSIPKLTYQCGEGRDDELIKSPGRRAALRAYSRKLELAAGASWWATSIDDLNACAITGEARALTNDERRERSYTEVYGDRSTRLLVVVDPCIKYSYETRNAFVLQRAGGRVYATQVLDAFYTRLDPGVGMELARHNGETLVVVETDLSDGFMPPSLSSTYSIYAIDPRTYRAVPRNLFMDGSRLTNEFNFPGYLFEDEETEKQWHFPELVHNGQLSPQFDVYTLTENQGQAVDAGAKFSRKSYVWNGRYYAAK